MSARPRTAEHPAAGPTNALTVAANDRACPIIGQSRALNCAIADARRAARLPSVPVLLLGERGTGKELFARLVHEESGRGRRPLVAVNCASLGPQLADAQLFGHRRGAFTGANESRDGFVGAAEGGTLFLDEVGELPLDVQARLLRLLQEGTVAPVGEPRERTVDVRVVAATNRDLWGMVREGQFRADLLDRLAVVEVRLPPLRDRKGDLRLLAEDWLARHGASTGRALRLGRSAGSALAAWSWPGNVRELQRVLTQAAARVGADGVIAGADVRAVLARDGDAPPSRSATDALMAVIGPGESLGMAALVERAGLPRSTLKAAAARLVASGQLGRSCDGRATRYWRAEGADSAGPGLTGQHSLASALVEALRAGGPAGCGALAEALHVSQSTVLRALTGLLRRGVLTRQGLGKSTIYRLLHAEGASLERGEPLEAVSSVRPSKEEEALADVKPHERAPDADEAALPELDTLALDLARARGSLARRELVVLTGASPRTALRSLGRLRARGLLIADGRLGCATRYHLPGAPPAPSLARARATTPPAERARPRGARATLPDLSLTLALVVALQRGRVEAAQLQRQVGVPLAEASAVLEGLAARGLLIRSGACFVLAELDRPPPGG